MRFSGLACFAFFANIFITKVLFKRILGSTRDGEWTTRKESSLAQEAEEELTECTFYSS